MGKRTKVPKKRSAAELELESIRTEFNILPGKSVAGHIEWLQREITDLKSRDARAVREIVAIRKVLRAVSTESVMEAAKRVMETPRWDLNYQYILRSLIGARPEETTEDALERVCHHFEVVKSAMVANRFRTGR
jgi:hypothetical protein